MKRQQRAMDNRDEKCPPRSSERAPGQIIVVLLCNWLCIVLKHFVHLLKAMSNYDGRHPTLPKQVLGPVSCPPRLSSPLVSASLPRSLLTSAAPLITVSPATHLFHRLPLRQPIPHRLAHHPVPPHALATAPLKLDAAAQPATPLPEDDL
jgi:hypothetical protein